MSLVVSQKVCSCDHKAITHNYPIKNKRNTAVLQLKRLVLASQGWVMLFCFHAVIVRVHFQ
jgi:hypothetical protein